MDNEELLKRIADLETNQETMQNELLEKNNKLKEIEEKNTNLQIDLIKHQNLINKTVNNVDAQKNNVAKETLAELIKEWTK